MVGRKSSQSTSKLSSSNSSLMPNGVSQTTPYQDRDVHHLLGGKPSVKRIGKEVGSKSKINLVNGTNETARTTVDDSRTVIVPSGEIRGKQMVSAGKEIEDVSGDSEGESDSEVSESDSESELDEDEDEVANDAGESAPNEAEATAREEDQAMPDVNGDAEAESPRRGDETTEPSFGELVQSSATEAIDVDAAFRDPSITTPIVFQASGAGALQIPSGTSLGTVLTQALRTNDAALLESCLRSSDTRTVKATIERLESRHATTLLLRLADRMHRRPGRAGSLMVWIQWTLIAHGGYLASQPDVMNKLSSLHRVVSERASGLQSLLNLKGKLDMLDAQMQLRKRLQRPSYQAEPEEDYDERIIYVEGQTEQDSDGEEPKLLRNVSSGRKRKASDAIEDDLPDESDDEDEMPTTVNGVVGDSDASDDDDSQSNEDVVDDEAEETEADTGDDMDEDDIDLDDADSIDEESESEDDLPPSKKAAQLRVNGVVSSRSR
ncbi:MAG: Small subunit (SSU) processome component [Caeruleum heppii]|nr:MAG: Small subunit (SSU) processome component [Caeruleum heppii]